MVAVTNMRPEDSLSELTLTIIIRWKKIKRRMRVALSRITFYLSEAKAYRTPRATDPLYTTEPQGLHSF